MQLHCHPPEPSCNDRRKTDQLFKALCLVLRWNGNALHIYFPRSSRALCLPALWESVPSTVNHLLEVFFEFISFWRFYLIFLKCILSREICKKTSCLHLFLTTMRSLAINFLSFSRKPVNIPIQITAKHWQPLSFSNPATRSSSAGRSRQDTTRRY